jgi:hypothetical protein
MKKIISSITILFSFFSLQAMELSSLDPDLQGLYMDDGIRQSGSSQNLKLKLKTKRDEKVTFKNYQWQSCVTLNNLTSYVLDNHSQQKSYIKVPDIDCSGSSLNVVKNLLRVLRRETPKAVIVKLRTLFNDNSSLTNTIHSIDYLECKPLYPLMIKSLRKCLIHDYEKAKQIIKTLPVTAEAELTQSLLCAKAVRDLYCNYTALECPGRLVGYSAAGHYWAFCRRRAIQIVDEETQSEKILSTKNCFSYYRSFGTFCCSPNGRYCAVGFDAAFICLWDIGQQKWINVMGDELGSINSIDYSPDGNYIAAASDNNIIKICETQKGRQSTVLLHPYGVDAVRYCPKGNYIASICSDDILRLWDLNKKECKATFDVRSSIFSDEKLCFSPEGCYCAYEGCNGIGIIDLYNADKPLSFHEIPCDKSNSDLALLCYSPDGKQLACVFSDNTIQILDTKTECFVHTINYFTRSLKYHCSIDFVAYASDAHHLVIGFRKDISMDKAPHWMSYIPLLQKPDIDIHQALLLGHIGYCYGKTKEALVLNKEDSELLVPWLERKLEKSTIIRRLPQEGVLSFLFAFLFKGGGKSF